MCVCACVRACMSISMCSDSTLLPRWGVVAHWLERATGNRVVAGWNPAEAVWKLAISFTPLCQCLSEETLKAVVPFYLVSMPGEIKDPISLPPPPPAISLTH